MAVVTSGRVAGLAKSTPSNGARDRPVKKEKKEAETRARGGGKGFRRKVIGWL